MKEENIILYDSDEAATYETRAVTGWWSGSGRFWDKDERTARFDGSTHRKCKCGKVIPKIQTLCRDCEKKHAHERYLSMPEIQWDGKQPLAIHRSETFFFQPEDLYIFCQDNGVKPENLDLVWCEPVYIPTFEAEFQWEEVLVDDGVPDNIQKIIDLLNDAIEKEGPISWLQVDKRVVFKKEPANAVD